MTTPAQNVVRTSWNVTNQTNIRKELQMDNQKPCRCLEIINERMTEINRKTTPFETIDEKDFYEIQALLKIYDKIQAEKIKE